MKIDLKGKDDEERNFKIESKKAFKKDGMHFGDGFVFFVENF